jgi:phosphoserine phosphatase
MLEMSRHPVAVHPDETLRSLAESEGWRIVEAG